MRGNLPVRFLGEGAAVTPLSYPTEESFLGGPGFGTLRVMPSTFLDVDPRELRLPSSSATVDPFKLQQQIANFGASTAGMPPLWVYEGSDGVLAISNGITRATRIAKLAPGTLVRVEVVGRVRRACGHLPKIGDVLS